MTDPAGLPFVVWIIFLPLAAAVACFLFPRRATALGLVTCPAIVAFVAGLAWQLTQHGPQSYWIGGWATPLGIHLRADGLSLFLLAMVTLVGIAVSVYAASYYSDHEGEKASQEQQSPSPVSSPPEGRGNTGYRTAGGNPSPREGEGRVRGAIQNPRPHFWTLWMFLWASLNALLLSNDVFNLYIALELLGLAAVALVALEGKPVALGAAMRYLLVSLLGSLVFLLGVALLYGAHATLDMTLLGERITAGPVASASLGLMTAGLLMKTALFPLHFWLPPAHANAPAPVSALLSALVVKASLYLVLRLWFEVFAPVRASAAVTLLGALGAGAILWGSYQALRQERLKQLVAYSTVAQLGYMFLLFPLAHAGAAGFTAWAGGLYLALSHACAKTVMFLASGNLMRAAGHDRLADLGGIARALPVTMFAFGLAAVSIVGLPPSGGFVAKWMLLTAALADGQWWWAVVIALGSLMAAGYAMRVVRLGFIPTARAEEGCALPRSMEWTALALGVVAIALGLLASHPLEWLRLGAPVDGPDPAEHFMEGAEPAVRVLISLHAQNHPRHNGVASFQQTRDRQAPGCRVRRSRRVAGRRCARCGNGARKSVGEAGSIHSGVPPAVGRIRWWRCPSGRPGMGQEGPRLGLENSQQSVGLHDGLEFGLFRRSQLALGPPLGEFVVARLQFGVGLEIGQGMGKLHRQASRKRPQQPLQHRCLAGVCHAWNLLIRSVVAKREFVTDFRIGGMHLIPPHPESTLKRVHRTSLSPKNRTFGVHPSGCWAAGESSAYPYFGFRCG